MSLDLAFDPHAGRDERPAAPRPATSAGPIPGARAEAAGAETAGEEIPPEEAIRLAGAGTPGNLLLAPLYAWRAIRRFGPLREEIRQRTAEAEKTVALRRERYAACGKAWGRALSGEPALTRVLDAARKAHAAMEGHALTVQGDVERFRQLDGELEAAAAQAETEKQGLRSALAAAEAVWRKADEDLRRAQAKQHRVDIEIRALERSATGPILEGTPLFGRRTELSGQRAAAAGEVSGASAEAARLRGERDRIAAEIAAIDRRLEERRAAASRDPVRRRMEEALSSHRKAVDEAMGAVAELVLARKLVPAGAEAQAQELRALDAAAEETDRARRAHEAALASLDRKTIAVGAAIPLAVLVLLIVLAKLL